MTTPVQASVISTVPRHPAVTYPLRQLLLYFLRLGTLGFGGPVALVGAMHRDLVEQRGWVAEEDDTESLALATAAILWRTKRIREPILVLGAAVVGLVASPLVGQ